MAIAATDNSSSEEAVMTTASYKIIEERVATYCGDNLSVAFNVTVNIVLVGGVSNAIEQIGAGF